jgi:hypothetical protein
MCNRIPYWHSSQPNFQASSNTAPPEVLTLAHHQALVALYRPSPSIPEPGDVGLITLANAFIEFIQICRRLHRENKLRLFWQAVHNLFAAGMALLYCYTHSPSVREQISLRKLEAIVHACSAALWAMVERFPTAKGKLDAFDSIATAVLDSLSTETPDDSGCAESQLTRHSVVASTSPGASIPELGSVVGATDFASWTSTADDQDPLMADFVINPALFQNGQDGPSF